MDKIYNMSNIPSGVWNNLLDRVHKEYKAKYGRMNSEEVLQMLKDYEAEIDGFIKTQTLKLYIIQTKTVRFIE